MTEPDFDRLKETPQPDPAARRRALAAALDAFDAAQEGKPQTDEKSTDAPQGNVVELRLNERSQQKGRSLMSTVIKSRYMIAASLIVLVAVPVVVRTMNTPLSQKFGSISSTIDGSETRAPQTRASRDIPEAGKPIAPSYSPPAQDLAARERNDSRLASSEKDALAKVKPETQTNAAPMRKIESIAAAPAVHDRMQIEQREYRDRFDTHEENPVKAVASEPVSTFSIDVDTASYSFARRALMAGRLPPKAAVRVEEMINYFPYAYAPPEKADPPFRPIVTVTPAPWAQGHQLVHIGIKGYELQSTERPRANLVFLIDVSGSMSPADRLPMVKNAFRMLVDELKPTDTVAIVTYAAGSGVALAPTPIADKAKIIAAIDSLGAGGSTAGAQGIQDAYRLAEAHYDKTGVNRIILATDGDFNVGPVDKGDLKGFIERKREKGIYLSILGVGQDNYNDALMETLAQNGNGIAAYADTLNEARKVLVDQASAMLFPIANDVKIQVEWNPARVSEYRLIGYESRALKREDFNNDKVDAGDIGSGHTVTAIYEITPVGAAPAVDPLRYGASAERVAKPAPEGKIAEFGFLKMRYKLPGESVSKLIETPIDQSLVRNELADAPQDVRFSVAVAAYGQLLTGGRHFGSYGYDDVLALAQGARGDDRFGYRSEFLNLVRLAKTARP